MTATSEAHIEFCGEIYVASPDEPLVIGREGNIVVDDNPYLHRHFLQVSNHEGMWWLTNVGARLAATIGNQQGTMQAWLAPGARLPLVFVRTLVWFTAGPTTYEFEIVLSDSLFVPVDTQTFDGGNTTVGQTSFTPDQKLLLVVLSEQVLRRGTRGRGAIPSSSAAAERLGWTITKFNRKLDNVCQKLTRSGVQGLHGGPGKLAVNRRARLVEYALAARVVEPDDLDLLD